MKKILFFLLLISGTLAAQNKVTVEIAQGQSDVLQKAGYDFNVDNDSLKIRRHINVRNVGAVGDGTTNDYAAFLKAITDAGEYGLVYVPRGRYIITPASGNDILPLLKGQRIYGDGVSSVIKTAYNGSLLYIGENQDDVQIDHLRLVGSGSAANLSLQSLIFSYKAKRAVISDMFLDSCGGNGSNIRYGGAIAVANVNNSSPYYQGAKINNVIIVNSRVGLYMSLEGEYCTITNLSIGNGVTGAKLTGGNYIWSGGNVSGNTTGIIIDSSSNSAHGTISAVAFNHNTTAFTINKIQQGHVFTGCMFYYGNASITSSFGIKFVGCDFYGNGTYTFTDSYQTLFEACRITISPSVNPIALTTVSGDRPILSNYINVNK